MKSIVHALITCLLLIPVLASPASALDRVVVVADEWMPYNGTPGAEDEGYAIEILRAIFERQGIELVYIVQPWKRAIAEVRSGEADMVVGAIKKEAPDFIYPTMTLGRSVLCFYTNLKTWRYSGEDSLEAVITGLIEGYGYEEWLLHDAKLFPERFHVLHGDDAFPRLIRMLDQGRIQAAPASRAVVEYYLKSQDMADRIRLAGCTEENPERDIYYGLSPAHPQRSAEIAAVIDGGMKTLRNTGQLMFLLRKYGLTDWVKKSE